MSVGSEISQGQVHLTAEEQGPGLVGLKGMDPARMKTGQSTIQIEMCGLWPMERAVELCNECSAT
jgi:hypothetical protein